MAHGRFDLEGPRVKSVSLIHPLGSSFPTGMGVAAAGLSNLLAPELAVVSTRLNRWFRWINDCMIGGPLRLIVRMAVAQVAPAFEREGRWMLFSSHHAPLWGTGRHIVIVYDLIALQHGGQARMQHAFYRLLLPRVLRSATLIVTISNAVREELRASLPFLADRRIDVIPAWSGALNAEGPTGAERSSEGKHVLVVGARYPHKNLSLVLDAMAHMAEEGSGHRLVVAGVRRDLWDHLESWHRLESAGLLTALDYPTDSEVRELYHQAYCLVYPSLAEGQGLPPLEALSQGCPVVCSDIPVLRETCGDAAFYVDPNQSRPLAALLDAICAGRRQDELDEKSRVASEVLKRFSAQDLRSRWKDLLKSLP